MSPIMPESARPGQPDAKHTGESWSWKSIARFLYTQNPFYLVSIACVLHSTKLWYRPEDGAYNPWPLMAIICGYLALVTVTGILIVRRWRAWDDVRSILLMLLLLFVELSLTFDTILIGQPGTGRLLLLVGMSLSIGISEVVLAGLKIRLPALYRIPYHAALALLFLFPLAIVEAASQGVPAGRWAIYAFWPVSALVLTTMLPAIRRGRTYMANNGTPWRWPWYPWSLFVFLGVCITLRGFSLGLSFDPVLSQNFETAMRLESVFGLYFVVPMVLAVALLLLEAGLVSKDRLLQGIALALPIVCLRLSAPGPDPSVPHAEFLSQFMSLFGSPVWMTAWGVIIFYAYATLRQVPGAAEALQASLLLATCIGPSTVNLHTLGPIQVWPLWPVALVQAVRGFQTRNSIRCLVAALCATAALWPVLPSAWNLAQRTLLLGHIAGIAVLGLGTWFRDPFARYLRKAGLALLTSAALVAATWPRGTLDLPEWIPPTYLTVVVAITFAYAYLFRNANYFFAGLLNGLIGVARIMWEISRNLEVLLVWQGAGFFVAGVCWFALAVLISAAKAGALRRFTNWIPRRSG